MSKLREKVGDTIRLGLTPPMGGFGSWTICPNEVADKVIAQIIDHLKAEMPSKVEMNPYILGRDETGLSEKEQGFNEAIDQMTQVLEREGKK